MAPELLDSIDAKELRDLAKQIREYQETKKLSIADLMKKFPALGSDKTYRRILDGNLKELDLEKQLANYRSVWAYIEAIGNDEGEQEELYDDLYAPVQLKRVLFETFRENGNARFFLMDGASGMGKSCARQVCMQKYGQRLLCVEAAQVWNDSPMAMLGAILKLFGVKNLPLLQVTRQDDVIELLKRTRYCLLFEEGHHLGPRCLNVIKALINNTPGEFGVVAVDTLWKKLESAAYEECKQLTGNRLAERIKLGNEVRESDVQKILMRRVKWESAAETKQAILLTMKSANSFGRLAFVRDVCKRVNSHAEGEAVDLAMFTNALTEEVRSR